MATLSIHTNPGAIVAQASFRKINNQLISFLSVSTPVTVLLTRKTMRRPLLLRKVSVVK